MNIVICNNDEKECAGFCVISGISVSSITDDGCEFYHKCVECGHEQKIYYKFETDAERVMANIIKKLSKK